MGVALKQGAFEDGPRMERFDAGLAQRYFDAADRAQPIIVQHMLAGVNAHIGLDLGIAAQQIAAGAQWPTLREDFNRLNAVLASQVSGVVDEINELSPVLAEPYAVLQDNQISLINEAVKAFRDSAWRLAAILALSPDTSSTRQRF